MSRPRRSGVMCLSCQVFTLLHTVRERPQMVDEQVAQDLADVVMDHLDRGPQTDLAVCTIANGLSRISSALHDIQERDGNWSSILRKLRTGVDEVQISIEALRLNGV